MIRRSGSVAVAVALMVAAGGCGSDGGDEGVTFGGSPGALCVRVPQGSSMVVGEVLRAPVGADLTVEKIGLVDGRGVDATKAFIVPLASGRTPIATAAYPPSANTTWEARVPAANATIRAGEQANLLLVVTRTGVMEGSATALQITYLGGAAANTTSYQFRDNCSAA